MNRSIVKISYLNFIKLYLIELEYDFDNIESARSANCHGEFKDKEIYDIAEYEVTYRLINPDCDPLTAVEIENLKTKKEEPLSPFGKWFLDSLDNFITINS